jgi:hypothetical protein
VVAGVGVVAGVEGVGVGDAASSAIPATWAMGGLGGGGGGGVDDAGTAEPSGGSEWGV